MGTLLRVGTFWHLGFAQKFWYKSINFVRFSTYNENPFLSRKSSSDILTFFTVPPPPLDTRVTQRRNGVVRRWSVLAGRSEEVGQQPPTIKSPSAFYSFPTRTAPILGNKKRGGRGNNCAPHDSRSFSLLLI